MLFDCNVDCGEVLPGHRLVVRGLRDDGRSDDSLHGDYMGHSEGKPVHRVVSLVYALVPGLAEPEPGSDTLDVDVTVVLDPAPDPEVWGSPLTMGGERDARWGGGETAGTFGPFVFPDDTERVIAEMEQITLVPPDAPRPSKIAEERQLGTLELDLVSGSARWRPA